jgi:LytS/YehU family sensor histidine kinase
MYNALNTIKSLIRRDPPKAEQAVIDFSMYIRGNMDSLSKTDPIPFSEELDHIRYYCNIEQLRFRDKLDVFYEIGPDDFYVPTLSVQPIVENAIKHGALTRRDGSGIVKIKTEEQDGSIIITVTDNGAGKNAALTEKQKQHRSVGIENARQRLELQCGGTLEVEISDSGARSVIIIPKNTETEDS